jgi:hypothetical protein
MGLWRFILFEGAFYFAGSMFLVTGIGWGIFDNDIILSGLINHAVNWFASGLLFGILVWSWIYSGSRGKAGANNKS